MPRRASARLAPLFVLVLALLGMAGCTGLIYNRLDTLAGWYIQDLVSLDDTQRSDLHNWLESTLQWHRKSELSRYAGFLRELANTSARPGNAATYQRIETQVEAFGGRLVEQAAPDAARLLMTLSPEQRNQFETNLATRSRERSEEGLEALAKGSWHDKRARDIEKQLKRWTGTVTKEQHLLIQQQSLQFQATASDWLESQQRWRTALLEAMNEDSLEAQRERILRLLRKPETQWTDAYRAKATHNRQQSLAVLATLDASLTAAQRSRLQRELNRLAQQLEGMMNE